MDKLLLPPTDNIPNQQNRSLLGKTSYMLEVCGKMPTTSTGKSVDNKENRPFFVRDTSKKKQTSLKMYFN